MNSIDDLRRTLDTHAVDLVDGGMAGRVPAVRERVRVVRRRRQAAGVGVTAAVLAVVAGVTFLPGSNDDGTGPGPADQVVNVDVPSSLTATGYRYDLADTVEGDDGSARIRLAPSNGDRLVSWATSGADQQVTVSGGYLNQPLHFDDADFTNWVLVPASDTAVSVKVAAASGEPGLAVYSVGELVGAGYSKDGVNFRQDVAGGELSGALVGDRGEAALTLPVTSSGETLWINVECVGAPKGARFSVERDGEPLIGPGLCGGDALPVDMTGLGGMGFASRPGQQLELSLRVTDGRAGPLVDAPDLQVAIGAYSEFSATGEGRAYSAAIEVDGHAWEKVAETGSEGASTVTADAPEGEGPVYAIALAEGVDASVELTGPGNGTFFLQDGSSTSSLVDAGQAVTFTADGEAPADSNMRIVFYQRAD